MLATAPQWDVQASSDEDTQGGPAFGPRRPELILMKVAVIAPTKRKQFSNQMLA
jgi:hypothetical protein